MAKKLYDYIVKFIKRNYKTITFYVILICLFTFPLNYEVYTPGGLINLTDRIEIDKASVEEGSFNLTYVGAKKGLIPMILLSYIIPNWDLVNLDEMRIEEENYEEIELRGKIDLQTINQNAIYVAFKEANQYYKINSYKIVVYHVFESADTTIKTGDIIKKCNGQDVGTVEELQNLVQEFQTDTVVNFLVERHGKLIETNGKVYKDGSRKIVGLYLQPILDIETNIIVNFAYNSNEQGSSGGLMSALKIYNSITTDDLTKGDIIAGTGTINLDSSVGEISGVKYKLAGAVKNNADVFIVPSLNYKEALEEKEKNNYIIEIIEADNFKNVVEKLKNR